MKQSFITLLLLWVVVLVGYSQKDSVFVGYSQKDSRENLKYFPAAKDSILRYVIELDTKTNEGNYQVEIFFGKVMKVDCNYHTLMGKIEDKTVVGMGYPYYECYSSGGVMSTRMACPGRKLEDKFVKMSKLVKYNSKIPLVVYVPAGFEIRYKIWERQEEERKASIE